MPVYLLDAFFTCSDFVGMLFGNWISLWRHGIISLWNGIFLCGDTGINCRRLLLCTSPGWGTEITIDVHDEVQLLSRNTYYCNHPSAHNIRWRVTITSAIMPLLLLIGYLTFVCVQTSVFMTHSVLCNFCLHFYANTFNLWGIAEKIFSNMVFHLLCIIKPSIPLKTLNFFISNPNYSS